MGSNEWVETLHRAPTVRQVPILRPEWVFIELNGTSALSVMRSWIGWPGLDGAERRKPRGFWLAPNGTQVGIS